MWLAEGKGVCEGGSIAATVAQKTKLGSCLLLFPSLYRPQFKSALSYPHLVSTGLHVYNNSVSLWI